MDYNQKRMATHTWFAFGERELNYRVRDNSGDVSFDVEYAAIPATTRTVFERNNWLRNVGLIWCVIGLIQIGLALAGSRPLTGSAFWLVIGLGCLAFYRLTWSAFTVFDTNDGSIWVVQDRQHDEIVERISEERQKHLMAWYKSLNFEDDPLKEIQTVEWLVKQDVLTKKEGEARIAEIRASQTILLPHSDGGDEPGPQLH